MMRGGRGLEIDDARGVDAAVGRAGAAVVRRQRQLAVGRHHDVVGPLSGRQIDLAVGHLAAGDIEHGELVRGESRGQRALAVRREHHLRDAVGHRDRVGDLDVGAVDRKHADRIVAAVGDQRHLAVRTEAQPRRLLAAGDRGGQLRRRGLEIDDIDLVVRDLLQRVAVLDIVDRVRHQRDRAGRVDVEIDRRSDDGIFQGQAGDDLGALGIGEIDDQDLVLAVRGQDRLAVVVPQNFLIQPDDHERLGDCNIARLEPHNSSAAPNDNPTAR